VKKRGQSSNCCIFFSERKPQLLSLGIHLQQAHQNGKITASKEIVPMTQALKTEP
jgi:hypothetical protein